MAICLCFLGTCIVDCIMDKSTIFYTVFHSFFGECIIMYTAAILSIWTEKKPREPFQPVFQRSSPDPVGRWQFGSYFHILFFVCVHIINGYREKVNDSLLQQKYCCHSNKTVVCCCACHAGRDPPIRGPGKPRRPVFVRSCLLYAYKDNRNGPRGRPRFIGGSGFSVRRAATATPTPYQFQTLK